MKNGHFYSPSKGRLKTAKMIEEIAGFVKDEPHDFYRLVIGTDSQEKRLGGVRECNYVTAIVIHRKGKGARYFWKKEKAQSPQALRDKIYGETTRSLETAHALVPTIRKTLTPAKYDLEIHIDVGALGKTRDMIREVVGMVNGNGFTAKTKPESWAASSVADKHT